MTYPIPFNQKLHDSLIAQGYYRTRVDADYEAGGDAESGPRDLEVTPEHDWYVSAAEYIAVIADGSIDHREKRDIAFEQWIDSMNPTSQG
jgi:hypothetical protein